MNFRITFLALCFSASAHLAHADCTAVITPSGPTTFCNGDSVVLNAPTGSGLSYEWKRGTAVVGANATYTAKEAGDYTVTVNDGSCSQTSAVVQVVRNPLPGATINPAGPLVLCPGQSRQISVLLGIALPGAPQPTFTWKNGNTTIVANTTNNQLTVNAAGTYTVLVTNSETGCSRLSDPYIVTVNPLPTAVITPSWSTEICEGGAVMLDAGNVSGNDYQWKKNGAAAGVLPTLTVTETGDYKVIVTDNAGCKDSSAVTTVNVHPKPEVTISQGDTAICTGAQVVLPAVTADTGLAYTWMNTSGMIPGAGDSTYTATESSDYHVIISRKDVHECADTSTVVVLTVNDLPEPAINHEPGRIWTSGGFALYEWYRDEAPISGAGDSALMTDDPGLYKVLVTDANGCSNFSDTLRVLAPDEEEPSGITEPGYHNNVTFYPNPVQNVLYVHSRKDVTLYITNLEGRLVMEHHGSGTVFLGNLSAGVYLIRATDVSGGLLHYGKLVKE